MLQLLLMRCAFVIATMVLVFLEFMRVIRLPTVGVNIHSFMSKYMGKWGLLIVVVTGQWTHVSFLVTQTRETAAL